MTQMTAPSAAQSQQDALNKKMSDMLRGRALLDVFLSDTTAQRVPVGQYAYVDGGRTPIILPQSGLLSRIELVLTGTITVAGTVTSGKWAGWPLPAPFGIVKNETFASNQGVQLRNHSGWDHYRHNRARFGFDALGANGSGSYAALNNALVGAGAAQTIVPGANIAAGTFAINIALPIPITYNSRCSAGLLLLQNNSIQYTHTINWGTVVGGIGATGGSNDLITTLIGTGLTVTAAITATVDMEIYQAVPGVTPPVSQIMTVLSNNQGGLLGGDNTVNFAPNDVYTMLMHEVYNAGAPVAPTNLSNLRLLYSTNMTRFQEQMATHQARWLYDHNLPLTDGNFGWDLGIQNGLVDQRDPLAGFNSSQITNMQTKFALPSTLTISGNNGVTTTTEALRYVSQTG